MGRLPSQFAGRDITMRVPYVMPGELILTANQSGVQFQDAAFQNNVDMPFEAHRVKPYVTGLDANNNVLAVQMDQDNLQALVRLQINDLGKNVKMTKNPTVMHLLTKGSSERTWEWAEPYYMLRSESFQVVADSLALPAWNGSQDASSQAMVSLRIEVQFQGFLIVVAPPSNTR